MRQGIGFWTRDRRMRDDHLYCLFCFTLHEQSSLSSGNHSDHHGHSG